MADPDLELRGGWGGGGGRGKGRGGRGAVLIFLPCWPFPLQSCVLFLPKIRGGGGGGASPRSATEILIREVGTKRWERNFYISSW